MVAILKGKDIVELDWLIDSQKHKRILKYGEYLISIPL